MKLIHYKIFTIVLVILLVGSAVLLFRDVDFNVTKKISADEAGKKAVNYINKLQGQGVASLISASKDKEKGLYKLKLNVNDQAFESYMTLDGNTLFPDAINLEAAAATNQEKVTGGETIEGGFIKLADQEICRENDKPIVYYFGSQNCPHCVWEYPLIKEVTAKFGDKISFHDNMNEIKDKEIFSKYSDGGVPLVVLGCRYYRLGSGEQIGEQKETEVLTNLIQQLIDQK